MDLDSEHSLLAGHQGGPSTSSTWYIDSGATSHMTGAREVFSELSEAGRDVEVVLGDNTVVRAVGRGTITFQRESMSPMTLRNVLYVPGLKKNLVSVSTIEDRGLGVCFSDGRVQVYPKATGMSSAMDIGVRCGKMYKLLFQPQCALAHSSSSELCELWHRRMAHLHHPALRLLRSMVTGLPEFSTEQEDVCRGCALGKYTKTAFPSSDTRATGVLDLIILTYAVLCHQCL